MIPRLDKIRNTTSRWAFLGGIIALIFCVLLLVVAWISAAVDGMIPEHWGEYHGNHGPWRHYLVGRHLIYISMMSPLVSGCSALLSLCLKPNLKAALLLVVCIVAFLMIANTHFWLID